MTDVVEIIKKAIFNSWKDGLAADAYLDAYARAALAALNEAGYVVVPQSTMLDLLNSGRWEDDEDGLLKKMLSAAQPAPK